MTKVEELKQQCQNIVEEELFFVKSKKLKQWLAESIFERQVKGLMKEVK